MKDDLVGMQVSPGERLQILAMREASERLTLRRLVELEIARIRSLHDDNVEVYRLRDLFRCLDIAEVRTLVDTLLPLLNAHADAERPAYRDDELP